MPTVQFSDDLVWFIELLLCLDLGEFGERLNMQNRLRNLYPLIGRAVV